MLSFIFRTQTPIKSLLTQQVANFSRYISKSRQKRLPMTTKRAGKGYYKGKGGRKEGTINNKARFIVDHSKRTELVVPDLTDFKLKAYVQPTVKRNIRETVPSKA